MKAACAEKQDGIKAEEMRLIFKGKILKDELTIEDFKITDGLTIHLVKGKTAGAAAGGSAGADAGATTTAAADTSASTTGAAGAGAGAATGGGGVAAGAGS